MKKVTLLMALMLFCSWQMIFAQKTITGIVSDAKDGSTIPGVNVVVKGTTTGTITDINGSYTIKAPANAQTLVFSFVGYQTKEVSIAGQTKVDVVLEPASELLDEVVVTAFGISKERKALGYAISTVSAKDLTKTATSNFATSLYGKAAGVTLNSTPGGSTSATNITVRGINSITGKNQALIVLNGIPIRDGEVSNNNYWGDQRLRGNGLIDINPDDIESISILKGASAAALYGNAAVNGVVMITTKSGKGSSGLKVDFSSTYSVENVAYLPRYQNVRGAGAPLNISNGGQDDKGFVYYDTDGDGVKETRGILGYSINFGPKFDGQPTMCWDGVIRPYEAQDNRYAGLFQQAQNSSVNVAISQSNENSSFRLSLTRQDNEGISLDSYNDKNIVNFSGNLKFSKNFSTDLMVNYINQHVHNRPYSVDRLTNNFGGMMGVFDNADWYLNKYQTSLGYRFVTGTDQSLTPEENLIYNGRRGDILDYVWRLKKNLSDEYSNRLITNLTANWQILNGLSLRTRVATDITSMKYENTNYTEKPIFYSPSGSFELGNSQDQIVYTDVMLNYIKKVTNDIELGAMVGFSANEQKIMKNSRWTSDGLSVENWFDISASVNTPGSYSDRRWVISDALIGKVNANYKDFLFVEFTGRQDRTSTMHPDNNSFFYPSLNSSFIISDAFQLPKSISFSRIRASWGIVGNYPDPYLANVAFTQNTLGVQVSGGKPVLYTTLNNNPYGNNFIRPEEKHEIELGFETRFFNNRLGFDIAYYNAQIVDQILPLTLPATSGAYSVLTNIGTMRNKGIEVALNGSPIVTRDMRWDITLNFAHNKNIIEKLQTGSDVLIHADYDGNAAQLISKVGESMGDIYVHPVAKHANGGLLVDPNGLYKVDPDTMVKVGNAMPKVVGGFINSFTWKGISIDAVIDYRFGGSVMPTSLYWMMSRGILEESLTNMDEEHGGFAYYEDANGTRFRTDADKGPNGETVYYDGMLLEGVKSDGSANDYIASATDYYWTVYNWGGPQYSPNTRYELYVQKNNFIKMRELSIGYALPASIAQKLKAKNLQVSLYGRNLFYIYRSIKDMDAEQTTAGSRWYQNVNNIGTNPSTRTFGISLKASF